MYLYVTQALNMLHVQVETHFPYYSEIITQEKKVFYFKYNRKNCESLINNEKTFFEKS